MKYRCNLCNCEGKKYTLSELISHFEEFHGVLIGVKDVKNNRFNEWEEV